MTTADDGAGPRRFELATGRQLWKLNSLGLLPLALRRSGDGTVSKAAAWGLLATWAQLSADCPDCRWQQSCVLEGCFRAEQAAYMGTPRRSVLDDAESSVDRRVWAAYRTRLP